jgi:hypothetical protein
MHVSPDAYLVDVLDGLSVVVDVPLAHGGLNIRFDSVPVRADQAVVRPDRQLELAPGLEFARVLQAVALHSTMDVLLFRSV